MKLVTLYLPHEATMLGTLATLLGAAQELGLPVPVEDVEIDGRQVTKLVVPLGDQPLTLPEIHGVTVGLADAGDTVALVAPTSAAMFARIAFGKAVAWVTEDPDRPRLSRIGLNLRPGVITWLKPPGGPALGIAL